ncbi:MAG: DUF885 domain-containing protein [Lacunisphaera sp.]|nr:DUF885 domain-containing protein [Lacunisphaera sp.]
MHYSIPVRLFRLARLALGGVLLASPAFAATAADAPAWIAKSNANAQVLVDGIAKLSPEFAGRLGVKGYDDKIADLAPGAEDRTRAMLTTARDELAKRALSETDPRVRQDLEILAKSASDRLETDALNEHLVQPYADVAQLIFFGEFSLLDDQIDAARRPAALSRLRRYTGLEPGTSPATELAKDRYLAKAGDPALLPPYTGELQQHLSAIPQYAAGIRQLYGKYGIDKLDGAPAALDALDAQLKDYADWIRATVLPKARADHRLPAELYADNLKNIGLDIAPQELIQTAQLAFTEIRNEMNSLAPLVAKDHGFADSDYRAVIHDLKKEQLGKADVEPYYHTVITAIEAIIRREKIVSLPDRPLKMRIASPAENAAQPAPHYQPPPLIGAKNEQGVFVLTTGNADATGKQVGFDDFTFKAGAWTLTAHEGRPGHDLQFAAMVERGVSLARSLFAFNSVNVEGWALYAEAETKPYEPLDGQLIALQLRLMRSARAFLDPMLNLGLITRERALEVLMKDVCLSEGMANQEVDRYTFRAPGQACAYFYGYTKLMQLRTATEVTLGAKFDRQAFNDFIIGQGLLPPEVLAKSVREDFIPAQLKK